MCDLASSSWVRSRVLNSCSSKVLRQHARFMPVGDLHADEHVRGVLVADAVVEFRHIARADERAEALEAAALFAAW